MVRSNCDPKKPTLLGIHDYWTGVPTTFDLHCSYIAIELNVLYLKSNEFQSNRCAQAILPLIAFLGIEVVRISISNFSQIDVLKLFCL